MGCASSKRVEVANSHVYRPAPASFAVFDINSIQEPWVKVDSKDDKEDDKSSKEDDDDYDHKTSTVPDPILQKLSSLEALNSSADSPPQSWDQVSKVLEDLKPTIHQKSLSISPATSPVPEKRVPRKSFSFHTIEELEKKAAAAAAPKPNSKSSSELKRFGSNRMYEIRKTEMKKKEDTPSVEGKNHTPVRENMFIKLDRMEMEKEGRQAKFDKMRRNPLYDYPDLCPPGGADSVVLYTTTLRGVRRTFEDCTRARTILELQRVVFDERDVSLHAEFLKELKDMLGGKCEEGGMVNVPKLFVKGRYVGGVDELVELNETGRLNRLLNSARVERGVGRQGCEGCGGVRFVPCLECGGSCKVVVAAGKKERCGLCNENGLVQCPACT